MRIPLSRRFFRPRPRRLRAARKLPRSHHRHILLGRASAPYSLPRPCNGNFAHASRSDGLRNLLELQALHPAQPSVLVLYCSDFTLTLLHTTTQDLRSRSFTQLHRQVPGSSQPNWRATRYLGEIWVSDCMLQRLHARLLPLRTRILHTHTHTEFG